MDKLTTFQMMCMNIATIMTMQHNDDPSAPAYVLDQAMKVRLSDLEKADPDEDLATLANEFTQYVMETTAEHELECPAWLPENYWEREPFYGGEGG